MTIINGNLFSTASGIAHLGVDTTAGDPTAFSISSIAPFGHIHMNSGVFHDSLNGQSGVLRYSQSAGPAFEVSIDGGKTFSKIATGLTSVTSVGVINGANLVGDIDLSPTSSGFIVIGDTGGASPITFSLDVWALSGLFKFPTQGFNSSVVNALTDFNGTTAQGIINVVGVSGIVVDIIGQQMTITPGPSGGFATCYVQAFASSNTWVVNHNLNTPHVIVQTFDNGVQANQISADRVKIINNNQVNITFNVSQAGKVYILACRDIF